MKHYSEEVIGKLQDSINGGDCVITTYETEKDFPKNMFIGGVKVSLNINNNIYDVINTFNFTFDKDDFATWKIEPLGKFYGKDWKYLNKGISLFDKYLQVSTIIENVGVVALLREIQEDEFDNSPDNMYDYEYYSDIIYQGNAYAIIKMYVPDLNESYDIISSLEDTRFVEKQFSMYGKLITDEYDGEDTDDEMEDNDYQQDFIPASEELF